MPTFQLSFVTCAASVNLLRANRAILTAIGRMVVQMTHLHTDTSLACSTMKEVLSTACFADSTTIAVELFLRGIIVIEAANFTEIFAKLDLTIVVFAKSSRRLFFFATVALDLYDSFWIELVRDLLFSELRLA